jgi:hypothetical protein
MRNVELESTLQFPTWVKPTLCRFHTYSYLHPTIHGTVKVEVQVENEHVPTQRPVYRHMRRVGKR